MKALIAATAISLFLAVPVVPAVAQTAAPSQTSEDMFYTQRGEWLTSKLIGVKVDNFAKETIGDINDLLIDKDGNVASTIVGVGGFLGAGERHAAMSFSSLQITRDADGKPLVRVNVTKDQLKSMPEWKWQPASTEWRVKNLIGVKVSNSSEEIIGDINDLLIKKDGKVAAVVIGVGGYLGFNERNAAISFSSLKLTRDANNNPVVHVNVTKDQLKAAPEWTWQAASAK